VLVALVANDVMFLLCRHFHAGMDSSEKERVQMEWTMGHVPVIVATIAFGMGERPP